MNIKLNAERRLYVLSFNQGVTCHGFDVVHAEHALIAERLGRSDLLPTETGTIPAYHAYRAAVAAWSNSVMSRKTFFEPGTPSKVQEILERYRANRKPIRLFYGDPTTGRDHCEEFDVVGKIGRSGGALKVPLLVAPGDIGGGAIRTSTVLRIMDVLRNANVYVSGMYACPTLEVVPDYAYAHLPLAVKRDGKTIARFKTTSDATIYVAFMTGEQAAMPHHLRSALRHSKAA